MPDRINPEADRDLPEWLGPRVAPRCRARVSRLDLTLDTMKSYMPGSDSSPACTNICLSFVFRERNFALMYPNALAGSLGPTKSGKKTESGFVARLDRNLDRLENTSMMDVDLKYFEVTTLPKCMRHAVSRVSGPKSDSSTE